MRARIQAARLDPATEGLDTLLTVPGRELFDGLHVPFATRDGTIWLRRYRPFGGEGGGRWDVVGEDGRWLATVQVPDHFSPRVVTGERVVGITVDSLGVERVQLYRLQSESRLSQRRSSEGPAGG